MTEQWQELKETITEMRDNDGTGTQQEVCKFLVNYMEVLEKQVQEPKIGHWIDDKCSICGKGIEDLIASPEWYRDEEPNFCPFCGVRIVKESEKV